MTISPHHAALFLFKEWPIEPSASLLGPSAHGHDPWPLLASSVGLQPSIPSNCLAMPSAERGHRHQRAWASSPFLRQ